VPSRIKDGATLHLQVGQLCGRAETRKQALQPDQLVLHKQANLWLRWSALLHTTRPAGVAQTSQHGLRYKAHHRALTEHRYSNQTIWCCTHGPLWAALQGACKHGNQVIAGAAQTSIAQPVGQAVSQSITHTEQSLHTEWPRGGLANWQYHAGCRSITTWQGTGPCWNIAFLLAQHRHERLASMALIT
jgi:hypothetical protein